MDARKEMFKAKQRYADRVMRENSEIPTLSEQQHEALAWICGIRHKVHSADAYSLFNSDDFEGYWQYIDTGNYDNLIKQKIAESDLPEWDWECDASGLPSDIDCYEGLCDYTDPWEYWEQEACFEITSVVSS